MNYKEALEKKRDELAPKTSMMTTQESMTVPKPKWIAGFNALLDQTVKLAEALEAIKLRQSPAEMWMSDDETIESHWKTLEQIRYESNEALTDFKEFLKETASDNKLK